MYLHRCFRLITGHYPPSHLFLYSQDVVQKLFIWMLIICDWFIPQHIFHLYLCLCFLIEINVYYLWCGSWNQNIEKSPKNYRFLGLLWAFSNFLEFISIFLPLAHRFFIKEFIPDSMLVSLKLLRICRVWTILILMSILYIFLVQTTLGFDIFCFRFFHHNWGILGKRTKTFS